MVYYVHCPDKGIKPKHSFLISKCVVDANIHLIYIIQSTNYILPEQGINNEI